MTGLVRDGCEGDRRGCSDAGGEVGRRGPHARLGESERSLRILFLVSAHNSLSQRVFVALTDLGHEVSVEVVDSSAAIEAAVDGQHPS